MSRKVMAARYASVLSCGHLVWRGRPIIKRDGEPWLCLDCTILAILREHDGDEVWRARNRAYLGEAEETAGTYGKVSGW